MSRKHNTVNNDSSRSAARGGWQRWMGFGITILGLAMATGFGAFVLSLMTRIEEQGAVLGDLGRKMEETRSFRGLIESRDLTVVALNPAGRSVAWGRLYLDRSGRKAMLQVKGLHQPDSAVFHLWMSGSGGTKRLMEFTVPSDSARSLLLEKTGITVPESPVTFAITVEPGASRNTPAGTMVLAGSTNSYQKRNKQDP